MMPKFGKTTTVDELREQVMALGAEIAKLSHDAADDVTDGFSNAAKRVAKSGRKAQKTVGRAVSDQPFTTIGAAVGLGALLGFVLGLCSRTER